MARERELLIFPLHQEGHKIPYSFLVFFAQLQEQPEFFTFNGRLKPLTDILIQNILSGLAIVTNPGQVIEADIKQICQLDDN